MSAKVYNPMILSEISTLRSPAIGRRPAATARITAARVKRDLFGPVDKEDSKKFIERELAAQNEVLSKKWGFDFRSGEPLQNHEQYQWERVPPTSAPSCFVGGMVALTRAAHVIPPASSTASEDLMDQRAERENGKCFSTTTATATASSPAASSDSDEMDVVTHPLAKIGASLTSSSSSSSSFPASATRARRQQRITDYLKERKRLSSSAPKVALAKRARQMLSSGTSPSAQSQSQ